MSNLPYGLSELIQAQCLGAGEEDYRYCFLSPSVNPRKLLKTAALRKLDTESPAVRTFCRRRPILFEHASDFIDEITHSKVCRFLIEVPV